MAAVGATGDEAAAKEVGAVIGGYLRQSGFTLDFAPVTDVNTNPENLVIGERAFGDDPQLVARMVGAEIEGLHEAGVLSCVKHFPGHGDTRGDTHDGYVSLDKTWDELKACELIPFVDNLSAADLVMVAHITLPNVTATACPPPFPKSWSPAGCGRAGLYRLDRHRFPGHGAPSRQSTPPPKARCWPSRRGWTCC